MGFSQYKCPCCGSALRYSGKEQKLTCDGCGNTYEVDVLEQLAATENAEEPQLQWEDQHQVAEKTDDGKYICPSCGGIVEADEDTISTKCPYCDNVVVIQETASGEFEPDGMIPFKIEIKKANQMLEDFCKGKKLLPKSFKNQNLLRNLKGYYVPYWLFDSEVDANMSFNGTRTRMWSDSQYNYTETSHYLVNRAGDMAFYHVPVDGRVDMDDRTTESIEPFDYKGMTKYNPAYLAGYETQKYDVPSDTARNRAKERIYNSAEQELKNTATGYQTLNVRSRSLNSKAGKILYALMPIWVFESEYQGKTYQFAINGQTGKMVGELPVDKGAFWKYLIGFTSIGTVVFSIIGTLLFGGVL